jgi:TRAP-type mannitol/chloroaromatic compound transport system permease large subunit
VPLAVTLGLAGTAVIALAGLGIMSVPTNVYAGIAKYPLLAIPVFVLAGLILERAGVAASIVVSLPASSASAAAASRPSRCWSR